MNLGQMRSTVRTRLDESSAVFWTDTDIDDALNEGVAELADACEFEERWFPLRCATDRMYYNLVDVMPKGFLGVKRIYNTITSRWLIPTSVRDLDATRRQWETNGGQPERYFLRGYWWLGVWPKPDDESTILRVYYPAIPDVLTDDVDFPRDLQREFHQGIVDYALHDCLAQSRETKKAIAKWQSYQQHEAKLKNFVQRRTQLAGSRTL